MYDKGVELPKDDSEVVKWYRKAADTGDRQMQVTLAMLLLNGKGGTANPAEALQLCQTAANRNYAPGVACAGLIYEKGIGTAADSVQAAKWFQKGAELGHPIALAHLGEMYWNGIGVK